MSVMGVFKRRWESRDQQGELLVETLVTLLLVSILVPSLLLLMTGLVFSAASHRRSIAARNIATTVVEAIDDMDYEASCDPKSAYVSQLGPVPQGYDAPVISVRFLSPTADANPVVQFQDSCVAGDDQGLQEITATVSSSGTRPGTGTVTLIKRNDDCAAGATNAVGQKC